MLMASAIALAGYGPVPGAPPKKPSWKGSFEVSREDDVDVVLRERRLPKIAAVEDVAIRAVEARYPNTPVVAQEAELEVTDGYLVFVTRILVHEKRRLTEIEVLVDAANLKILQQSVFCRAKGSPGLTWKRSLGDAERIALKRLKQRGISAQVTEVGLEVITGVLVYEVDASPIKKGDPLELIVDANTGKVYRLDVRTKADD